jgi:hypothetical protein
MERKVRAFLKKACPFTTLFLFLFVTSASAAPEIWMKKRNPENLGLLHAAIGDCPFSPIELRESIGKEFVRARLRSSLDFDFFIAVFASCIYLTSNSGIDLGYVIHYRIDFGKRDSSKNLTHFHSPRYDSMIAGGPNEKRSFLSAINEGVADALTDYLKANSD